MLSTISASFAGSKPIRAASKLALALVLEPLASLTEMEVAWLRFFYQFGPFEDISAAVWAVAKSDVTEPVNIGSGTS